ncbi:hypothetical protein CPAR01_02975 [Colletotrichum paranaense]|uniref:Uncharacterized protein n=1 Tax=Colletotrichum paranaense TaxID=1914294 RepID=A0ABQ9T116_9PEZI|nr:uncharacterized protein CPAR01_02975 [Colletotrichum paranaense]KAK1545473.1 hypothetical protein CPAR01_02975 [Colletotrichum paranaense]
MGRRLQLRDEDCPFAAAPFSKRPRYTANHEASLRSRTRCHHAGLHTSTLFRLFGSWSLVTGQHCLGLQTQPLVSLDTPGQLAHSHRRGGHRGGDEAHLAHSLQMPCQPGHALPCEVVVSMYSLCAAVRPAYALRNIQVSHPSLSLLCRWRAPPPLVPGPSHPHPGPMSLPYAAALHFAQCFPLPDPNPTWRLLASLLLLSSYLARSYSSSWTRSPLWLIVLGF